MLVRWCSAALMGVIGVSLCDVWRDFISLYIIRMEGSVYRTACIIYFDC